MVKKDMNEINSKRTTPGKLTAEMIESLPECIKKWLYTIDAVGHEQIYNTRLKQSGKMKLSLNKKYGPHPKRNKSALPIHHHSDGR